MSVDTVGTLPELLTSRTNDGSHTSYNPPAFATPERSTNDTREANDRGFECLILEDCCGATDRGNHDAAIKMVKMQGGVFGTVSDSQTLISQLP